MADTTVPTEAVPPSEPITPDAPLPPTLAAPPEEDWDMPMPAENLDELMPPQDDDISVESGGEIGEEPAELPLNDKTHWLVGDPSVRFVSFCVLQAVTPTRTEDIAAGKSLAQVRPLSSDDAGARQEILDALRTAFSKAEPRPLPAEAQSAARLGD